EWPATIQCFLRTGRRLIQVDLPSEMRPFLTKIRRTHDNASSNFFLKRQSPVLNVGIHHVWRCGEYAWRNGCALFSKRSRQVELRKNRTVILHHKVNKRRIQPEEKQAIAYSERIKKDPVPRANGQLGRRLPRNPNTWPEIVSIRSIQTRSGVVHLVRRR